MQNDILKIFESPDSFKKTKNEELRKYFKNLIKPNIMIKLKEDILHDINFASILLTYANSQFSTIQALGHDDVEFDICSNMAIINWFLMLPYTSDEDKSKKYKDVNYQEELKRRTIKHCSLRSLIDNYEEKYFLFSHAPINYSMHCTVNFLLSNLDNKLKAKQRSNVPNANFRINTILIMLKTIKSILFLVDTQDYGNAFSLLRTLIEHIIVYLSIYDNEQVANAYYAFMGYRLEYEATDKFPKEFLDSIPSKINKKDYISYINYGWIDCFNDKKTTRYTLSELVNHISKTDNEYNERLLKSYRYCCKFAHGNYINSTIPQHSFLWILINAGEILANLLNQYNYIFNENSIYNGINLYDYLTSELEFSIKHYDKLTTDNK